jgi:TolB protein
MGLTKTSTKPRYDGDPSWSPNGEKIAFSGLMRGNWDIYVVNADGTEVGRLTRHPGSGEGFDGAPDWQPLPFEKDQDAPR